MHLEFISFLVYFISLYKMKMFTLTLSLSLSLSLSIYIYIYMHAFDDHCALLISI
jgi:hypothetical protein